MKESFTYIMASILGGVVSEINKPVDSQTKTARHIFAVGSTSVLIGIIFGLGTEWLTNSTKLAIAASALAGVGGFSSVTWITRVFKRIVEKKVDK